LNKLKSPILFDQMQAKQDQQLPHVRLCARVCQFQVNRGRHFHLEQPVGSGLVHLKVFESVLQRTVSARFDMCKFGLRIPKTNRFLRKRSQILTTSKALFYAVHGSRCADQHIHQRIEGSANINGIRQSLTNFSATYCRGFAEMMARNLCKAYHTHVGDDERALTFHSDDVEERPSKRLKINPQSRKRHQTESETPGESISARPSVPMSDVPTPNVGDPNPNQTDAQPVQLEMPQSEPWQTVFELAQDIAPRVGNTRCPMDSEVWTRAQTIVQDHMQITDMFVCRGTERYQVPLHAPSSHQCPLRHTVCMHRETSVVHDLGSENWHNCTRAQRIRKGVPSKLTLTMFGQAPSTESTPVPGTESMPIAVPSSAPVEPSTGAEPPSAVRASGSQNLPLAVHARSSKRYVKAGPHHQCHCMDPSLDC